MEKKKYIIGISPCPNDTYMFDPIVNKKIEIEENFTFEFIFEDIATLNRLAEKEELDIAKLSTYTYYKVKDKYTHIKSGAVIVFENGPILFSKKKIYPDEIPFVKIGIPGINTTAYSLLKLFYQIDNRNLKEYKYYQILEAIMDGEVDAGIIIHEQRFVINLKKYMGEIIIDLGKLWYEKHLLPLPLSVIGIHNKINKEFYYYFESLLKESVDYALKNSNYSNPFIKKLSHIKNEDIIRMHINAFVDLFSSDMGMIGERAINKIFEEYKLKEM